MIGVPRAVFMHITHHLMLCCHHLENLNHFGTRGPTFFILHRTGPSKLHSQAWVSCSILRKDFDWRKDGAGEAGTGGEAILEGPECTEIGGWGGEQRWVLEPSRFLRGPPQPVRRAWGCLGDGEQCYLKLHHSVSIYGPPAECLASCWALWVQRGLGELTLWFWGTCRRKDTQQNPVQGVGRASEHIWMSGPPPGGSNKACLFGSWEMGNARGTPRTSASG